LTPCTEIDEGEAISRSHSDSINAIEPRWTMARTTKRLFCLPAATHAHGLSTTVTHAFLIEEQ
jgi:hypothetical protein